MAKWAIKLSEFDISYQLRTSIKGQALTDFLVECSWTDDPPVDEPETPSFESADLGSVWVIHVDDVSNAQESGAGMILTGLDGFHTEYALRFSFEATNNQVEYEVLLTGLKLVEQLGAKHLTVFIDSQLVVGQTTREYEARDLTLEKYYVLSQLATTTNGVLDRRSIIHRAFGDAKYL